MGDTNELQESVTDYRGSHSGGFEIGDAHKKNSSHVMSKPVMEPVKSPVKRDDENKSSSSDWLDVIGNGDIMKRVLTSGIGKHTRPDSGQVVTVSLKGSLENGTRVEYFPQYQFTLGDADVVQGLDLAVPLMEVQEEAEIVIQPRFAYGSVGKLPEVPPNSVMKYTLRLLKVDPEPDIQAMSVEERMEIGGKKRDRGNFWYNRGDYSHSVLSYRRALDYLDDEDQNFYAPAEVLQNLLEEKIKVYNNMAAAQLKMEAFEAASKSVDTVLKVQPNNVKALYRKAKILSKQGNIDDAIVYMKKAQLLEPDRKVISQDLQRLLEKKKTESYFEREMYRRMLGGHKVQIGTEKKKGKTFTALGTAILGGVAAVLVGLFVFRQYHTGW